MRKTTLLAILLIALPVSAMALSNDELLALVAMPLAVAAVADIAEVPVAELVDVVTLLNDANVPPVQFVEVVRYVPVAIADEDDFVDFVRTRQQSGLAGPALVTVIEERVHALGLRDVDLDTPAVVVVDEAFIPAIVRTRVAAGRRQHPHGGPPGQLKKAVGVQTGAEIVHGTKPGRDNKPAVTVIESGRNKGKGNAKKNRDVVVAVPRSAPQPVVIERGGGPGHSKGQGGPPPHAQGGGKGKGKGKG